MSRFHCYICMKRQARTHKICHKTGPGCATVTKWMKYWHRTGFINWTIMWVIALGRNDSLYEKCILFIITTIQVVWLSNWLFISKKTVTCIDIAEMSKVIVVILKTKSVFIVNLLLSNSLSKYLMYAEICARYPSIGKLCNKLYNQQQLLQRIWRCNNDDRQVY